MRRGCGQPATTEQSAGRPIEPSAWDRASVNVFRLSDGWRGLDMDEAKRRVKLARLPTPPRARQHAAQAGEAGQGAGRAATHRMRRVPSLPTWQDDVAVALCAVEPMAGRHILRSWSPASLRHACRRRRPGHHPARSGSMRSNTTATRLMVRRDDARVRLLHPQRP